MTKSRVFHGALLALFAVAAGAQSDEAQDSEDEADQDGGGYIEEIVVTGERGEQRSLDRSMTVTGFNATMIEEFGIQNTDDLEVLVPGLQVGVRSHAGKNEDGHLVMRGVANDRRVNFFQDSSVAVYIDGIYTPVSYGLDAGMFDVERIEVARGPQGTTGGKTAIAGSVSFVTKKPTPEWDMVGSAEFTDQASQRYNVAFGGPIADSNFSYRLAVGRLTGDGLIENVGVGPDAGKPDQLQYAPQLRFTNDRMDITTRYTKLRDTGVQKLSLAIGARNTEEQYFLLNDGTPRCEIDRFPDSPTFGECIRDRNGNIVYYINPFYGLGQNPAVEDCPGFNNDGSRDPGHPVVCEGKYLKLKTELNAPIGENNTQEAFTIEAHFKLNDTHEIVYHYGDRDTRTDISNDQDGTNRQPGGRCSAIHPRVLSGELEEGQVHPRCALDERGNGVYGDTISNYLRTSDQQSHEIALVSNNDGPLNYTVGYTYLSGDEPYVYRSIFNGVETGSDPVNNPEFYMDTTAVCEANLEALAYPWERGRWNDDIRDPSNPSNPLAPGYILGCYGANYSANWSDVTNGQVHANGSGVKAGFYGNVIYEQAAFYGNVEYVLNDRWKVFGGIRYNDDHKEHDQNDFSTAAQRTLPDGTVVNVVNAILRSKHYDAQCCGYVGLELDADGNFIPDDRTLMDSKRKTWKETTWTFGAEYSPTDSTMWYGRISRGYRAGGFAGFGNRLGEAFDPEAVINYEGGLKGLFFDNAVQLEVSAYFQDFEGFWIQSQRLRTPAEFLIDNARNSLYIGETNAIDGTEIAGIEAQGAWRVSDRLTVRGFYEYMYSSFGSFETNYCCSPAGTLVERISVEVPGPDGTTVTLTGNAPSDFGGNSLRMQPEHKMSAAATYAVPIPGDRGTLDVTAIMSWRDQMYPDESNLDIYAIPAYTRWDLRANWVAPNGRYSVSGWVTNLLDLVQVQSYSPRDGNGVTAAVQGSVTDSRRMGITFNYRMGEG
ncbi:MAG: TonB-dependent receptor [Gammaproteobacteria bacterium]|nr:TonB-dependent receptor [Gammaproteobacteria bacterium]